MKLGVFISLGLATIALGQDHGPYHPESAFVWFSPNGGCTDACVSVLNGAKRSIYVQAYSFTSAAIAKALVDAKRRGLVVEAILDKGQRSERYTEADFIAHGGIPTFIDARHAIAHNKIMIVDGETVITGSFNFTKSAEENNAENLLVLRDRALAARYYRNWQEHRAHSEVFAPRAEVVPPAPKPGRHPAPAPPAGPPAITSTGPRLGSVSCTPEWNRHDPYLQKLIHSIEERWKASLGSADEPAAPGSYVSVKFLLSADGNVVRFEGSSGNGSAATNALCERAVRGSGSYGRWTEPMIRDLGTSQQITLTFFY